MKKLKKIARRFYNRSLRLFLKNVVIYIGRQKVYKFVYAKGGRLIKREFRAAKLTQNERSIWQEKGQFYKPIYNAGGGIVVCYSSRLAQKAPKKAVDETIQNILNNVPDNIDNKPWYETLDQKPLALFWEILPDDQCEYVLSALDDVFLPVTGAHGDLIDKHFFLTNDCRIKIIDWEFFREKGSIVTDILRCYVFRNTTSHRYDPYNPWLLKNKGLPVHIPEYVFPYNIGEPNMTQLSILAAVTNVCLPVSEVLIRKRARRFSEKLRDNV